MVSLALATAQAQTFSNSAPITINDNAAATPYPSSISVSGLAGNIGNLSVSLFGFTHAFPDDVDILLVGPAGQNVLLMSDTGGANSVNGVNLNFADGNPALPDTATITSGTYSPTDYNSGTDTFPAPAPAGPFGSTLSAFSGTDGNGTWNLFVVDDGLGDVGVISGGWSMTVAAIPEPTTTALLMVAAGTVGVAAWRKHRAS